MPTRLNVAFPFSRKQSVVEKRFEVINEPSGFCMVWDNILNEPAMFGDRLLGGMSEIEAKAACEVMNEVHLRQKQARATNQTR